MKDAETLNANYEFYTGKIRFQPQGADIQICSMPLQLEAYTFSFSSVVLYARDWSCLYCMQVCTLT